MATTTGLAGLSAADQAPSSAAIRRRSVLSGLYRHTGVRLALLTACMLPVHGYHPFAEDGGLYAAGVERSLDPTLFPHSAAFVTAHLHYSLFAPVLALATRWAHLSLEWVLFFGYLAGLYLTLYAALSLIRRCTGSEAAQWGGVALLAAWATLPVAGTSLVLLDPYLTARSFSTPLSLLAIAFALDDWEASQRSARLCALCLLSAAVLHPLMTLYGLGIVVTLRMLRVARFYRVGATLCLVALLCAAVLQTFSPPDAPAAALASVSRYYWFLSQWQWYEICGLAGPLAIFAALLRWRPAQSTPDLQRLCQALLISASAALLVATGFCHRDAASHLVARLQPLRVFLLLYAAMPLLLAAGLLSRKERPANSSWLRRERLFAAGVAISCAALFASQRSIFPASAHIEAPFVSAANPWSQAFLWVRAHTPKDALFALDANYITADGEDAQSFRATAERSSLPDFSKDGGEASITPSLALLWDQGVTAQKNLSALNDAQRDQRLLPLGVTWVVLRAAAATQHACPYRNADVKVCRLLP